MNKKSPVEFLESRIKVLIPEDIGSQLMFKSNVTKAKDMEQYSQLEEISDQEIEDAGIDWQNSAVLRSRISFVAGAKWYREQLKSKI